MLIERARRGLTVVRLKGGDPLIFGRGGEEAEALADAGVPFELVPGVTVPLGIGAYAGVPLTHRGRSTSVSFVAVSYTHLQMTADFIVILSSRGYRVFSCSREC